MVIWKEKFQTATAECFVAFSHGNQSFHPPEHRMGIVLLRFDVVRLVMRFRIDDDGKEKAMRTGPRETGVPVGTPLHRGADRVAIAEVDIVAHPDLIAVVENRRAWQREQQGVHQFNLPPVAAEQCGEAPADAEVDPHLWIVRIRAVHIIAFFVRHHFEGQFVMIAEKHRPLTVFGNRGCLRENVENRKAILHA
jgi:hypothetical protein